MRIEKLFTHRMIRALRVLIPLLVVVLISIPAWNYLSRRRLAATPPQALALPKNLALRTEGFTYSQTEGGRTVFSIKARTNLGFTDNRYMLEDIDVTIYGTAQNDPVRTIRSKTGSYDEQGGSFTFSGEVEVDLDEKTTGRTDELTYNHGSRLVASTRRTFIEQPGTMNAQADNLGYSLDTGLLKLTGDVRVRTHDGAALESGAATFHQKENWAAVTDGVYLVSSNGWIRGATGRAELAPQTFEPKKIVIEGVVNAQSDSLKLRSGWLEAAIGPNGTVESLKARGEVEIETVGRESPQILTGGEVDAAMDSAGELEMLEARENARMTMGSDRKLSSARIRTNGRNSVVTFADSVMEAGDSRIEGRDFAIEQGDIVKFSTAYPASMRSGTTRTSAGRTAASFDSRTNQLIDLVQTGNFQFKDEAWEGRAQNARFEDGGQKVTLTGSPFVATREMQLEGGEIGLNQNDKSFTATANVRTVTRNAGEPVLVFAGEARGSAGSIVYTRKVELWRGKAYIKADRLEVNNDNRLRAEGNVSSNFESIRASSGTLEYNDRLRTAHYAGKVKAHRQDMSIESGEMTVKLQPAVGAANGPAIVAPNGPPVQEIIARGDVVVMRGGQRGSGEEATYDAATDNVTLKGSPAQMGDRQRGSLQGTRLVMNSRGDKVSVESGPAERAVARQQVKPRRQQ